MYQVNCNVSIAIGGQEGDLLEYYLTDEGNMFAKGVFTWCFVCVRMRWSVKVSKSQGRCLGIFFPEVPYWVSFES